jgi:hypothetical protein
VRLDGGEVVRAAAGAGRAAGEGSGYGVVGVDTAVGARRRLDKVATVDAPKVGTGGDGTCGSGVGG